MTAMQMEVTRMKVRSRTGLLSILVNKTHIASCQAGPATESVR